MSRIIHIASLLLFAISAQAAGVLSVHVDSARTVMGMPLAVEVRGTGLDGTLEDIPLDELHRDFEVFARSVTRQSSRRGGREVTVETMALTLYPLRAGELTIPAFNLGSARSPSMSVNVSDHGENIPVVGISAGVDQAAPYLRQGTRLTLDVADDGSLQWSPIRELEVNGAYISDPSERQLSETVDGQSYTVHRFQWSLLPLRESGVTIRFPMLDAYKFGMHLRFPAPVLSFTPKPVPTYLPVYLPIGKPSVTSTPLPSELIVDRPVNWRFTISAPGLTEAGVRKLLADSLHHPGIHFYAPVVEPVHSQGQGTTLAVTLPIRPMDAGSLSLPALLFPYYNPETGKVEHVALPPERVMVVDPLLGKLILAASALLTLSVFGWVGYVGVRTLKQRQIRLHSLQRLDAARTAEQVASAVRLFDDGLGPYVGNTLGEWLAALAAKRSVPGNLRHLIREVEEACFGVRAKQGKELEALKCELRAALASVGR